MFENLITSFHHLEILARNHIRMTNAMAFSCQNVAGSRVRTISYYKVVVFLVLVSKVSLEK